MKEQVTIEKILYGNTTNSWKPVINYNFDSYNKAKEFLNKDKQYTFSHLHRYNLTLNINNY